MSAGLLLAAAGLTLLPPAARARLRLVWLADTRWPELSAQTGAPAMRRLLDWVRLADRTPVLAVLAGASGWLAAGPVPGLLSATAAAVLNRCRRRLSQERAATVDSAALSAVVAALGAEQAAGAPLDTALLRVAGAAPRRYAELLRAAGRQVGRGGSPGAALATEADLTGLAVAVELAGRTGLPVNQALQRLRADLRADQQIRAAVGQVLAGPRASALLLALLPAVGLAIGAAMGAGPLRVLLHTSTGLAALAAGVLLDLAGLYWTVRLTTGPSTAGSATVKPA